MQSGWPDTSLGDTLVNAAMKTYIHGSGKPWISIVNGDDSVTVTLEGVIPVGKLVKQYADLGMEVEVKYRTSPLDVEFCSANFRPVGDTYVLMANTGRILSKLGWDMVDRNPVKQRRWLRAIADTLACYGHYDPVLEAVARACLRSAGKVEPLKLKFNEFAKWFDLKHPKPQDADVFAYYHWRYGLMPTEVHALVKAVSTEFPCFSSPTVLHIARTDI